MNPTIPHNDDREALAKGNRQMYWLLLIWLSIGGGIFAWYEHRELEQKENRTEVQQTKNPEEATSGPIHNN